MKHISHLSWTTLPLVFNPKEKILLKDAYINNIILTDRLIRQDKELTKWRRLNDKKSLKVDLKSIEFVNLLDAHGYDVYDSESSTDVNVRSTAFRQLNELSKAEAIAERYATYTRYDDKTICRCGDWFFCIHQCDKVEEITIDYNGVPTSGGKRPGSGRKSQFDKLKCRETATIRVPAFKKEKIKTLIDWLIDMAADGKDINSALFHAASVLEWKDYRTEADVKARDLLNELALHLPRFSIANHDTDDTKNESVTKSN